MRPSSLRYERAIKNVEAEPFRDPLTACKTTARFINALLGHGEEDQYDLMRVGDSSEKPK